MDDTTSIWDVMERQSALVAVGAVGAEPPGREARPAAACSPYLESTGKDCDGRKIRGAVNYEVCACGCRSWFCKHCCRGRGLALRGRLLPVLGTFTGLQMWTLTIDPELFSSPQAAFEYVREKRSVANLVRRLYQRGYLHSKRYFCVLEWQKNTEMIHFHVLLDASFIEFDAVCELWNRNRPPLAGPVRGVRPGFGSVRFTNQRFADHRHACNYACKYLIKFPEHGYPDWVMDFRGEIHRFYASRGFWGHSGSQDDDRTAGGDVEPDVTDEPTAIRQRVSKCGLTSVLIRRIEYIDVATREVTVEREFVGRIPRTFDDILLLCGVPPRLYERRRLLVPGFLLEKLYEHIDNTVF